MPKNQRSHLLCQRCSDQGYVETGLGRLGCLQCSSAPNFNWIPGSQPPTCEANAPASRSIQCLGVVATIDCQFYDLVAYWPARDRWTATRFDGIGPEDVEVEVARYIELELPELAERPA